MKIKFLIAFFIVFVLSVAAQDPEESTKSTETTTTNVAPTVTTTVRSYETETTTVADNNGSSNNNETATAAPVETTTPRSNETETTTVEPTTTTTTTTTKPASFTDDVATSTKNLLGINCMVQAVYNVEDIAPDFTYKIGLCGSRAKKEAVKVLANVKQLQTNTKTIERFNKKVCKNENYKESADASEVPSADCVKKIQDSMDKLNLRVDSTLTEVNKSFEQTTNACASMALLKFRSTLNNFSAIVKECARLASNI